MGARAPVTTLRHPLDGVRDAPSLPSRHDPPRLPIRRASRGSSPGSHLVPPDPLRAIPLGRGGRWAEDPHSDPRRGIAADRSDDLAGRGPDPRDRRLKRGRREVGRSRCGRSFRTSRGRSPRCGDPRPRLGLHRPTRRPLPRACPEGFASLQPTPDTRGLDPTSSTVALRSRRFAARPSAVPGREGPGAASILNLSALSFGRRVSRNAATRRHARVGAESGAPPAPLLRRGSARPFRIKQGVVRSIYG